MTFHIVVRPGEPEHQSLGIRVHVKITEDLPRTVTASARMQGMAAHPKLQVEYPMTFKDVVAALLAGIVAAPLRAKPRPVKLTNSTAKEHGE
jgi:hypothetical protein